MRTRTKLAIALLCITALLFAAAAEVFAAGTASNPLISRAYLINNVLTAFKSSTKSGFAQKAESINKGYVDRIQAAGESALVQIKADDLAEDTAESIMNAYAPDGIILPPVNNYRLITISNDQKVVAKPGTVIYSPKSSFSMHDGSTIDLANAYYWSAKDMYYPAGSRVMVSESGDATVEPIDGDLTLYIMGEFTIESRELYTPEYTRLADTLKIIGLFKGSDQGYQLDRVTLRTESLTMLVRLLGQERAALALTDPSPFGDTPAWFSSYARYCYDNGITLGIGNDLFGSNMYISASQYLTFILRTLGYTDTGPNPDFYYLDAISAAVRFGVLTQKEAEMLNSTPFYRDQLVYVSYVSLFARYKGSSTTLLQSLTESGAVDRVIASFAIASVQLDRN
ncbi:MAG: hypothetical protein IKM04_03440 [Clostridia bacterium]|nr:hypothetical protein [Clostridia bacterium]